MTDVLFVGGGLANSLIAWRLAALRSDLRMRLIEQGASLGGDHTWAFHHSDLTAAQRRWLEPLVVKTWPRYEVRFPKRSRGVEAGFSAITSRRLNDVVSERLAGRVTLGVQAREVGPRAVRLADGSRFEAACVIDGRGLREPLAFPCGYHKFLAQVVELSAAHGLTVPVLMDATVEQQDGYRFVSVLPWSARALFLEEARYSDSPDLDRRALRKAIKDYAASSGWTILEVQHEEEGVLPIPLAGDLEEFWRARPAGVACSGMRAALFHPTTGYALPEAVRLADALATLRELDGASVDRLVRERSRALWRRGAFYRLVNRMVFRASPPPERYRIFEHLCSRNAALIRRFHAGQVSSLDKLRLLAGRPLVSLRKAAAAARA